MRKTVFVKGHKINVGRKHSEETKKKMSLARKGKVNYSKETIEKMRRVKLGKKNPMFGKKHKKESIKLMSEKSKNEKNGMWKGDNIEKGGEAIHDWVRRRKPKPKFCVMCKINPPYDLANISGEYKRDINDFKWICRRCHLIEDGRMVNNLG